MSNTAIVDSNQKRSSALLPRTCFVASLVLLGTVAAADLIGADPWLGQSAIRLGLLWAGAGLLAVGLISDFGSGQSMVTGWLRSRVLDAAGMAKFSAIVVQLALLVLTIQFTYLENNVFYHNVMLLTAFGFVVHYFLPVAYRMPFFLALSLACFLSVFGLQDGLWIVAVGVAMLGVCHLPLALWMRVAILLAGITALMLMRTGHMASPWTKAIWPILASMFMFRLIIYMYELRLRKVPFSLVRALSYFFLLPNVAFPLFPVVDYATFHRTYYNEDEYRIYQRGVKWIFWGVTHLLIYRVINYYLVLTPDEVTDVFSLSQFMTTNYALIIRLSGQFHLIIGILHLFGFNLPRIMHHLFLASSFNDYWRRVNIYWKDFIQKIFYYPLFFKMRKSSVVTKIVAASLFGFGVTWFLHGYQWFWIRGSFNLSLPDILFWSTLAVFMVFNSLVEMKSTKKRNLKAEKWQYKDVALRASKTSGIFITITLLWSLWTSPTLTDWFFLFSRPTYSIIDLIVVLSTIWVVAFVGVLVFEKFSPSEREERGQQWSFQGSAALTGVPILALFLLFQPALTPVFGSQVYALISDLRVDRLSARDAALLEKGYYEDLNNVNNFNTQLWEIYMKQPERWVPIQQSGATRRTGDFIGFELIPSKEVMFKDAPLRVNRWGMHDDDYPETADTTTFRIAMSGGSISMGSGVVQDATFEALLENKLNEEGLGLGHARYEILNFSVGGYSMLQRLADLERRVFSFKPDMLMVIVHPSDDEKARRVLAINATRGRRGPIEGLKEIAKKAGIRKKWSYQRKFKTLEPYTNEIMEWVFSTIVKQCRDRGVTPLFVCLPSEAGMDERKRGADLADAARSTGAAVLELTDVYKGYSSAELVLAPWDKHPNVRGHRIIADRLFDAIRTRTDLFRKNISKDAASGDSGTIEAGQ